MLRSRGDCALSMDAARCGMIVACSASRWECVLSTWRKFPLHLRFDHWIACLNRPDAAHWELAGYHHEARGLDSFY
jgi:hypothetical protein